MDYLQYWSPKRAALAFGDTADPVYSLANGWFWNLEPGDRIWILTSQASQVVLALRAIVATPPVLLRRPPPYAVGNSRGFRNWKVDFAGLFHPPRAIPIEPEILRELRFTSTSKKLSGPLNKILNGPLSAKKPLHPTTVERLESLWENGAEQGWTEITVSRGGRSVFSTAEHRGRVEKAAVKAVSRYFEQRGWKVASRERDGVGYDLDCRKAGKEIHVEVKGTAGELPAFFLTPREYRVLHRDDQFRLAVVTHAIAKPHVSVYTPRRAKEQFRYSPIAYSAVPKK